VEIEKVEVFFGGCGAHLRAVPDGAALIFTFSPYSDAFLIDQLMAFL
jgi:hypothetical protein